jgi:hypothetical protein
LPDSIFDGVLAVVGELMFLPRSKGNEVGH